MKVASLCHVAFSVLGMSFLHYWYRSIFDLSCEICQLDNMNIYR